jgi:DNA adenine methylase
MKPIIKWSGGKSKEIPIIHKYRPKCFDRYYEPFIGGGAFWFNLNHNKNTISDNFTELIEFYQSIKTFKHDIVEFINKVVDEYNSIDKDKLSKSDFEKVGQTFYYYYRDNEFNDTYQQSLKFYLLRQLSFSGMLRFSKKGNYNVPFGWYKNIKRIQITPELCQLLDNTEIKNQDWNDTLEKSTKNDFTFLDPPYTRKFQNYSPYGQFGEDEHIKLSKWFKTGQSKSLLILNKDEFTYELYKDYIIGEYDYRYSIQYRDRMTSIDSNAIHFVAINYELDKNPFDFS